MSEQSGLHKVVRRRQVVEFKDRKFELAALTLRDLNEVRQQALDAYRREYVRGYEVAYETAAEEDRKQHLDAARSRAAQMTVEELPDKMIRLPKRAKDGKVVLDDGGNPVIEQRLAEYGFWWGSETIEGKIFSTWLSMRACEGQEGMTLGEVDILFTQDLENYLDEAADAVVELSNSTQAPDPNRESRRAEVREARRRKREERRRRGK